MTKTGFSIIALFAALGPLVTATAEAQQSLRKGLDNCASISNAAERLFCFDSLAAGNENKAPVKSPTTASNARPAVASSPPAAASRPSTIPAQDQKSDDSGFGRELAQTREGPESITSRYVGTFSGWTGNTVFQLENGQVWKQVESDRLAVKLESPVMTVRRGWFGTFYLKVEGTNKQIRVKRIR